MWSHSITDAVKQMHEPVEKLGDRLTQLQDTDHVLPDQHQDGDDQHEDGTTHPDPHRNERTSLGYHALLVRESRGIEDVK